MTVGDESTGDRSRKAALEIGNYKGWGAESSVRGCVNKELNPWSGSGVCLAVAQYCLSCLYESLGARVLSGFAMRQGKWCLLPFWRC
jgi:hypothetical protein